MLTSLKALLEIAEDKHCAILAPDFATLTMAKAMIEEADSSRSPLILSYYMAFQQIAEVRSFERLIAIVRDEIEAVSVPICLHLDHGSSLEEIGAAIDAGFSSVMIDASHEVFEVNIQLTTAVVEMARPVNVSVEAELGVIASSEAYFKGLTDASQFFTDPDAARKFVDQTGIDALAVSIGNVHGKYDGEPKIDFERLRRLDEQVSVPLVLHGSSGIDPADLQKAVGLGIRKVNLFTEVVEHMYAETAKVISEERIDPIKVVSAQHEAVRTIIADYLELLKSKGTA
jgi:fructose-bisphosphate aldolase class II